MEQVRQSLAGALVAGMAMLTEGQQERTGQRPMFCQFAEPEHVPLRWRDTLAGWLRRKPSATSKLIGWLEQGTTPVYEGQSSMRRAFVCHRAVFSEM